MSAADSLSPDLWKIVASFCVDTHELRTVCNVAQDLCSLQSVCKSSSQCATSLWRSLRNLCYHSSCAVKPSVASLREHFEKQQVVLTNTELSTALSMQPDLLVAFVQVQTEKNKTVSESEAIQKYHLDQCDLADCQKVHTAETQPEKLRSVQRHCGTYSRQAVIHKCNQKWGGLDGLKQHKADLQKAKIKAKYAKIAAEKEARDRSEASPVGQAKIAVQLRRSEEAAAKVPGGLSRHKLLLTSLASRGLQLRTDNKICTDYIKQGCDQPEQIADNLFCMKWVLDNTDYSARHQKAKDLLHEKRRLQQDLGNAFGEQNDDLVYDWQTELRAASYTARFEAMTSWLNDHGKDAPQLRDIPDGLRGFIPMEIRKAAGI